MKKKLLIILLIVSSILVLTSCGKKGHEHELIYIDAKPATCTEYGVEPFYYCNTCKKPFKDKDGTIELTIAGRTEPLGHIIETVYSADESGHYHKCSRCGAKFDYEAHTFDDTSSDYILPTECTTCGLLGSRANFNGYLEELPYNFKTEDVDNYKNKIDEIKLLIEDDNNKTSDELLENYNLIIDGFDVLDEYDDSLSLNQLASEMRFYIDKSDEWSDKMVNMQNIYSEYCTDYNKLLLSLLRSNYLELYKEQFNYTDDDVNELISRLLGYDDPSLQDINNRINELEYNLYFVELSDSDYESQFVELRDLRNQKAQIFNYDNYYEYAYQKVYQRSYSTDQIKVFREYVQEYILNIYIDIFFEYLDIDSRIADENNELVEKINNSDCFNDYDLLKIATDYFKLLKDENNDIDFYETINEAFKDGRVFRGEASYSFASLITEKDDTHIMYFGKNDYNSSLFSLIHESGHFMFIDGPIGDYDYLETHSQSNEQLFLAYLDSIYNDDQQDVYNILLVSNFMECFRVIYSTLISDEIEEAIYKNYYSYDELDTSIFEDGIDFSEYDSLFKIVCQKYGVSDTYFSNYYDRYFADRSCYEISYAVSLIPCMALLADAKTNGFEVAMEKYFNTYLYMFDEEFMDAHNEVTYMDVLEYANYPSPFEESTYILLKDFYEGSLE